MKTILFGVTTIFLLFLNIASEGERSTNVSREPGWSIRYDIAEIDGCEYIVTTGTSQSLAHKGNCKNHK